MCKNPDGSAERLGCCAYRSNLFFEGIKYKKSIRFINYQAYDISYPQYEEFIRLIESVDNYIKCFKPVAKKDTEITLELTGKKIFPLQPDKIHLNEQVGSISLTNTCRHSVVQIIQEVLHVPNSSLISNFFLSSLLCKTELHHDKPTADIPFYVLPPPPTSFTELSVENKLILPKLYKRIEGLLPLDSHSQQTLDKFNSLTELYNKIIKDQPNRTLDQLFDGIQTWKTTHKATIEKLRVTYFWDFFITRKSATSQLINEIEQDIMQLKNC